MDKFVTVTGAVSMLAAGVLANTVTLGTYGHFAKKRGWSSWKAGAMAGLVAGVIGMASWLLMRTLLPGATGLVTANRMRGFTVTQLPTATGVLTAQRLSGVYMQPSR